VPGKIQEYLLFLVCDCALSEKSKDWLVHLLSTANNRTSPSHLHLILEFFQNTKPGTVKNIKIVTALKIGSR
jgi:hypothetical protein